MLKLEEVGNDDWEYSDDSLTISDDETLDEAISLWHSGDLSGAEKILKQL